VDVPFVRIIIPRQINHEGADVFPDQVPWAIGAPEPEEAPEGMTVVKRVINFRIVVDSKDPVTQIEDELESIDLDPPITIEVPFTSEDVEAAGGIDRLKLACDIHVHLGEDHASWKLFGQDTIFGTVHTFWIDPNRLLGIVEGVSAWADPHIIWVR
jgi:hypothetical protein